MSDQLVAMDNAAASALLVVYAMTQVGTHRQGTTDHHQLTTGDMPWPATRIGD